MTEESDPANDAASADEPMPISQAPYRIKREHYRRERREELAVLAVLVSVGALILYGIWTWVLR